MGRCFLDVLPAIVLRVVAAAEAVPSTPRRRWPIHLAAACLALTAAPLSAPSQTAGLPPACASEPGRIAKCVKPSDTDAAIQNFDSVHYVLINAASKPGANLLVYLAGSYGTPPGPVRFLKQAADAGYRVISLAYNDTPSVLTFCQRNPVQGCFDKFRRMRIYGDQTLSDRPQQQRRIDRESIDQTLAVPRSSGCEGKMGNLSR
jgi:hypothetical protein